MAKVDRLEVNPSVLVWARETAGYASVKQAADEIGFDENRLLAIESGQEHPNRTLLKTLANLYKRAFTVLLLPEPPERSHFPTDYRTLPRTRPGIGSQTAYALRQARRLQEAVTEIVEEKPKAFPKFRPIQASPFKQPAEVASIVRVQLGVPIEEQWQWPDTGFAFRTWRGKVQSLGVIVLVEDMLRDECRGFSLWDPDLIPTIVVSSDEAAAAQIFTLFHEFGHVLLRSDAMCLKQENPSLLGQMEAWCNRFAAALLVPEGALRPLMPAGTTETSWDLSALGSFGSRFKVSRHVIAIRLEQLSLAPEGYYQRIKSALDPDDRRIQTRPRREDDEYGRDMAKERLKEVGFETAKVILSAMRSDVLSTIEAAGLLRLRPKSFERLASLADEQSQRYR